VKRASPVSSVFASLAAAQTALWSEVLPMLQANWYRAAQYCRYHGMHLASINSQEENDKLEKHIRDFGTNYFHSY
jgi:hypothetical protein